MLSGISKSISGGISRDSSRGIPVGMSRCISGSISTGISSKVSDMTEKISVIFLNIIINTKESFVQSVAMSMMPPKISSIVKSEWIWKPEGWPENKELPSEGLEIVEEVIQQWLLMIYDDKKLANACRISILNSIKDGFVVGSSWYHSENMKMMLENMNGSQDEKDAISCVIDSLEGGIHVRSDGVVINLEEGVVRFEDTSCHPVLVALWPEYGFDFQHVITSRLDL